MNIYTVKVQDDIFKMELSGKFEAATAAEAEEMAREDFAFELDTCPQEIKIVSITEEAKEMKKFEIGKTYTMTSICNSDCVWSYKVTERTAQTITITDGKEVKKCRISKKYSTYRDAETILPLGNYSMAPMLSA